MSTGTKRENSTSAVLSALALGVWFLGDVPKAKSPADVVDSISESVGGMLNSWNRFVATRYHGGVLVSDEKRCETLLTRAEQTDEVSAYKLYYAQCEGATTSACYEWSEQRNEIVLQSPANCGSATHVWNPDTGEIEEISLP